jgi:hypothetical protein
MELLVTIFSVALLLGLVVWLFRQGGRIGASKLDAAKAQEIEQVRSVIADFAGSPVEPDQNQPTGMLPVNDPAALALQATLLRIDRNLEIIKIAILVWVAISVVSGVIVLATFIA